MDIELLWLCLLFPVGFVAGLLNVIAGGGSFLTLPVLIAAGLPIHIANGTNRISVVVQGLYATASYKKRGSFDAQLYKALLPPLLGGALLGAYLATQIDPVQLKSVFGLLFLCMALLLFMRSRMKKKFSTSPHFLRYPAIFIVGVYGGFIQAGVGLWLLVATSALFGVDALRANTVKLPLTLTFTVPALMLFLQADMVRWLPGSILASGTVLGTILGVRFSIQGGETLILRVVTLVLLGTGIHLLL